VALLATFAIVSIAIWCTSFVYGPLQFAAEPRDFDIEHGMTLREVARKLHSSGITSDAWRFEILTRAMGKGSIVKAGSYQIIPDWSALQLLEAITGSTARFDKIVLLEGWTFREVRRALDEHVALRHDTREKSDAEVLAMLQLAEPYPEGLLFPDTYHFAKGTSDLSVLRRASARMRRELKRHWEMRVADLPIRTPYEALILASIIEKETGRAADRAMIAGVLINRLRKGMKLQADPTVIYGLGEAFDGNLRRYHIETDGPYNTYSRPGLPPTPIAMPGAAALVAAVRPAATSALYFVARGDGSSQFSESLAEHNHAVTKYQRQPARVR
jgi:UPF0755 protein